MKSSRAGTGMAWLATHMYTYRDSSPLRIFCFKPKATFVCFLVMTVHDRLSLSQFLDVPEVRSHSLPRSNWKATKAAAGGSCKPIVMMISLKFSVLLLLLLSLSIAAMSHARSSCPRHPARTSYPAPSSTICNVSSQSSGLMIYAYALQDGRAPGIGWQLFQYSDAGDSGVKIVDLTPIPGLCPPHSHPRASSTDSSFLCGRIFRQRHQSPGRSSSHNLRHDGLRRLVSSGNTLAPFLLP
jgi:hypothetical protein